MKKLYAILLMLMICFSSFAQKNNPSVNNQEKSQNNQGNNNGSTDKENKESGSVQTSAGQEKKDNPGNQPQDTKVTPGASGVKRSIGYSFSAVVIDDDPGKGVFRLNNESVSKATFMFVDDLDISGDDQSKWFSTWDDTTGATGRGQITLVESEGKGVVSYDVSGVFVDASGFWKIPVKHVSGTLPLKGATYYYVFERIDHKKDVAENVTKVVTPVEQPKPVEEVKPVEEPKPVEEVKPVEQPKPVEEVKPVEQPKPVEEVKPVEQPKVVEEVKPVEQPKPVEEVKPVEQPTVVEEVKPIEQPKPVEEVKPIEQPKTVEEVKPVEQPKPVEEVKPVEQPKPVEEVKPVEQPKPVEEVKPVEQPKPVEEVKPVEQPKPVEEVKPVEQPKPVEEVKPVEQPKPVEEVKPVEQPKPVEEVKPVEQPKPAPQQPSQAPARREQEPVRQTAQAAENPAPEQSTVNTTTQPAKKTGTTWTTQVTQGSQPAQNEPPVNQYNQNNQNSGLPAYQYRYSTNQRGRGKWYAGIIEAGYGLGVGEYGIDNFRLNFINGFRIGQTFSAGLGIGVRRYYVERENFTDHHSLVSGKVQIPVFLDLRKTFSTKKVTPYLALGIGNSTRFSAGDTTTVKEGLLFTPSGGIWFNFSSRFALFCGVAYEMQKMEYLLLADDSRYKKNTSSVSLNIGIAF